MLSLKVSNRSKTTFCQSDNQGEVIRPGKTDHYLRVCTVLHNHVFSRAREDKVDLFESQGFDCRCAIGHRHELNVVA